MTKGDRSLARISLTGNRHLVQNTLTRTHSSKVSAPESGVKMMLNSMEIRDSIIVHRSQSGWRNSIRDPHCSAAMSG
jgi:hypothetical protein